MKAVIFGLTISSAWGNGHATLWRGLCRAFHERGHSVVFFERDVPYYAAHRDLDGAEWVSLLLYEDWDGVVERARRELKTADVAIVTSYCADGPVAAQLLFDAGVPRTVFYDLDSPVTLDQLGRGAAVPYLPADGLAGFDLVLSYAGGGTLTELRRRLGARAVAPLYGSVDPDVHRPVPPDPEQRNDLSYLGTYAADRQGLLEQLFLEPARHRPDDLFVLAGSQYPGDFPWLPNLRYLWHLPPASHASLFCSSRLTLNITRSAMAAAGYCPSGRLFEAAACGTALVSDWWPGIETFFEPGREVLIARDTREVLEYLGFADGELARIRGAARERALDCHTAAVRARELEHLLEPSGCGAA